MRPLGFRIERVPYHPSSGMTGFLTQKVRDDGRVGATAGDEALLWEHLMDLQEAYSALEEERNKLNAEVQELRRQLEGKRSRK